MSLFWAPDYFQSLNQVFLPEPGMLILIHDPVWAHGRDKICQKTLWLRYQTWMPCCEFMDFKKAAHSQMWDFKSI